MVWWVLRIDGHTATPDPDAGVASRDHLIGMVVGFDGGRTMPAL